ncbi:MAG TPA: SDR family NAD(P)-dependent oxidoreductase [Polyangiaceae bacterium]|jgi:NAD(P)-dependent dehydrogenase (short-subunit alcohol dehydrogenase family)|nr:SDR family NAD(P)-dependent oxidoreductase [Polyangiaceae bacterium]
MKSFEDKVAAITGAGSGMGRELACELAAARSELALSDINRETLEETAAKVRALGARVTTTVLDVSDRSAVHAWADATAKEFGRVNLIFNNAGVALASTLEGVSYEDFEWIMGINFWGVVYGTKAFLPHLRASGEGHVINVSSVFGLFSVPGSGTYNASKFAVRGFTEALRQELELTGPAVSATSVHPGGIKTNIARSGRFSPSIQTLIKQDPDVARADFEKRFITTANKAAKIILDAVQKDKRRVLVGPDAHVMDLIVRLAPAFYQRMLTGYAKRMGSR